ncbi:MFS transporter [Paremcibacter congregatus]|uniref:MFS transporter n=1 Tax=Paremcibacter congregatus TaxID=2043170 RepID=UPI0030ECA7C4
MTTSLSKILACGIILTGTIIGLAGIDLVLPAVPLLPEIFNSGIGEVQLVLAAYVVGASGGFLVFGIIASRLDRRKIFLGSIASFGLLSVLCIYAENIWVLVMLRFFQGFMSSAPAVIAPGMIRQLFSEVGAVRAISLVGSIESLVPALAPIAGLWLLSQYGWTGSFWVTGGAALVLTLILVVRPRILPGHPARASRDLGGYGKLLCNPTYLRYGLSHGLILGGLLVFVFSIPVVMIETMGGTIENFIYMQVCGVTTFIILSNVAGSLVRRFGPEILISVGSYMGGLSVIFIIGYAAFGGNDPLVLIPAFVPLNAGLGLRGGVGFMRALQAAGDDDARGSALIILSVTLVAGAGTAILAPFLAQGLLILSLGTGVLISAGILLVVLIPPLGEGISQKSGQTP